MQETLMDERGRVTLGKKIKKQYGKRFFLIKTKNGIILKPISTKDPIEGLRELGKKSGINKLSVKRLKKIALEEAMKEAATSIK